MKSSNQAGGVGPSGATSGDATMASRGALDHLAHELALVRGPDQRATPGVRAGARRIAREMLAAGASTADVRRTLARLVLEWSNRSDAKDGGSRPREARSLLADVLQCAFGNDTPRDVPIVDERRAD